MKKIYVSKNRYMKAIKEVYRTNVKNYVPCIFGYDEGEIYG